MNSLICWGLCQQRLRVALESQKPALYAQWDEYRKWAREEQSQTQSMMGSRDGGFYPHSIVVNPLMIITSSSMEQGMQHWMTRLHWCGTKGVPVGQYFGRVLHAHWGTNWRISCSNINHFWIYRRFCNKHWRWKWSWINQQDPRSLINDGLVMVKINLYEGL